MLLFSLCSRTDHDSYAIGGFRPSAAQGVQFAALFATGVPGAYDNSRPTAQFFSTNNQLYPYVSASRTLNEVGVCRIRTHAYNTFKYRLLGLHIVDLEVLRVVLT